MSPQSVISTAHLEYTINTLSRTEDGSGRSKQSRSEKKSRKAIQKLGMKPIPGIMRVTIKKSKNVSAFFAIASCLLSFHSGHKAFALTG
jgi:hypothetical protein